MGTLVDNIVNANSLFVRLQLPVETVSREEVKRRFRQLALEVHPDKCDLLNAKEAFQLIAEAFEVLSDPILQEQEISRLRSKKQIGGQRYSQKDTLNASEWGDWWKVSWTVFEKSFAEREKLETALRAQFVLNRSARYMDKQVRHDIRQAERTVRTLDEQTGVGMHALWPLSAQAFQTEQDASNVRDLTDSEAKDRLLDLLLYLRGRYYYCLFCGCSFNDASDLAVNCPGAFQNDH